MPQSQNSLAPIAIIGIGVRLPGAVSTTEDFWDVLVNGRDGKCRVPADRYNVEAFHGEKAHQQKVATEFGYFLNHINIKAFDASFFSAKRQEVEVTDPQQRILLEVVWECLENAGHSNIQGSNTGVFVGAFGEDWHNMLHRDEQTFSAYRVLSAGDYALANRISYEFDLRGPSMTIRTACSASLTGLHLACQALRSGDCDTAVVAGSSIIMDPAMTLDMSQQGVLSPTGSCKTFDASADGFARGEAVNALLIKPLDKAIEDGDTIRAVIRSSAVNSDGKTSHLGSPSTESQEALIRKAYQLAGIDDFSQTPFFECHGTGTSVGDPLEVAAVGNVFGGDRTYIGSIKPNFGHGEGASGITSIIKAVLSLEHMTIPPNINFTTPNPKIPFEKYQLQVPIEPIPWPEERYPRVSVNSFGIGGANAHVILDSAASYGISSAKRLRNTCHEHPSIAEPASAAIANIPTADSLRSRWPHILPVSAHSSNSLMDAIKLVREYIRSDPGCLNDLAYTLGLRRSLMSYRSFCIVEDGPIDALEFSSPEKSNTSASGTNQIAFVFTGQGAQWAGMANSLLRACSSFRLDILEMDAILQDLVSPPSWRLEELLDVEPEADNGLIHTAEFSQPVCAAVQIALVNFLKRCNIIPDAVVGHSSGEIAAAYTAGAITMREAITCAYIRGQVMRDVTRAGSMAAIGMGSESLSRYVTGGDVQIACENGPANTTISGDSEAVQSIIASIRADDPDIFTRLLNVDTAYHSNHMRDIGKHYEELLAVHLSQRTHKRHATIYSTVLGGKIDDEVQLEPGYWRRNLESTVLFRSAISKLLTDMPETKTIIEIGPHAALRGPLRQIFQAICPERPPTYIPTLERNTDSIVSILKSVGRLYSAGHSIAFSFINPMGSLLSDLPNYPWDHSKEFWKENRISEAWRLRRFPHHELLGSQSPEAGEHEPVWRNIFHQSDVSWLEDHKVGTNVVFPCAGFIGMMGEALRQTLGSESYSLRSLMVKAALILPEMDTIELVTSLRPTRITELTTSKVWYDISIKSFNGSMWTEHCTAQGKMGDSGSDAQPRIIPPHLRQVGKSYFYEKMNSLGLRYGPRFQGLENITADPNHAVATASMNNDNREQQEAPYAVHPTVLDLCLQLCIVAGCKGITRHIETLILPIDIRKITVSPGDLTLSAMAELNTKSMAGDVLVTDSTGQLVVDLGEVRGVPFETGDQSAVGDWDLARQEWMPHIDFHSGEGLIRRRHTQRELRLNLSKMAMVATFQTVHILHSLDINMADHHVKYLASLENETSHIINGDREAFIPGSKEWGFMDPEAWPALLDSLLKVIEDSGNYSATAVARSIIDGSQREHLVAVFSGEMNALEPLLKEERLAELYRLHTQFIDTDEFFRLLAHAKPNMNILEVGAGTGSTTDQIIPGMMSKNGVRTYSRYVFTDISAGFFPAAKDRFKHFKGIDYKILDIEKDPSEQGFELGTFDLVVASNVLHATSSLSNSLKNIRSLLREGGRLYLDELLKPQQAPAVEFITGRLPGWWNGDKDGRGDVPYVTSGTWDKELRKAGFSGLDILVMDDDPPYHTCGHMISRAIGERKPRIESIALLYRNEKVEFGLRLAELLEQSGVSVIWCRFGSDDVHVSKSQHLISVVELEGPFFEDMTEANYQMFIDYLTALKGGVLWLTRPAQICCSEPGYGILSGIARTVRIELLVDFWTLELEDLQPATVLAAASVTQRFCQRNPLKNGVDAEFYIRNGIVHVGRYHWNSLPKAIEPQVKDDGPKQIIIEQYGLLDSLKWVQTEEQIVGDDQVEVEIRCVGLNFRDVMGSIGIVPVQKDQLGFEATGRISRVGSAVKHVNVGDRVLAVSSGLFATHKVLSSHRVARIPNTLSYEEAVTIPIVYATVIHCVITLGNLQEGQSVLIHSGTGGVGQAAITVCQTLGAKIFATVGNDEKAAYLVENHGIPRERIFDSRSSSFLDGIMLATEGKGVDLVLNSLSGELLHSSWKCVGKSGKMMEIGKRDILEHGHIALDMLEGNRSLFGIDMATLLDDQPDLLSRLMEQMHKLLANEEIKPIRPIHMFPAQKIPEAMRFMKRGEHIGKIVIAMPENPGDIAATRKASASMLSSTSSYLIVGGLGGLGKPVARWMVERGARNFCFLSRSAGSSQKDQLFLEELRSLGCTAVAVAGSVADMQSVQKAIDLAPSKIAGVLQMSMVIRDCPALKMSYEDWRIVHDCKIKGTRNLHEAFLGTDLKFFIMTSSISGCVGHPGQMNYTSANTFLDSFAQYRLSQGLPASVVDLGGLEGIGFLSERPAKLNQYKSFGLFFLQERHLIDAIHLAIANSSPHKDRQGIQVQSDGAFANRNQFVIGLNTTKPLSDPTNRALYKGDARIAIFHNIATAEQSASDGSDEGVRQLLSQVEADPQMLHDPDMLERVSWEIGRALFKFLLLPEEDLDINLTLSSIGIDSLASIEIRNWWRKLLGVDITVLEIMQAGTIKGLGKLAIDNLKAKYNVEGEKANGPA